MLGTRIANQDGLLDCDMAPLTKGFAWVDGMAVVEAPADGVAFGDLIAHLVWCDRGCDIRNGKEGTTTTRSSRRERGWYVIESTLRLSTRRIEVGL